jgi:hypothetical protein
MQRRYLVPFVLLFPVVGLSLFNACSAAPNDAIPQTQPNNTGGTSASGTSGQGGSGTPTGMGGNVTAGGAAGDGIQTAGGASGSTTIPMNKCHSGCGPEELCDEAHLGYDDNCNGQVDEGCSCQSGQSHWCFLGDPAYRFAGGCFDGVEKCTEFGIWGSCLGGKHGLPAGPDSCIGNTNSCQDIAVSPFAYAKLAQGTGTFGSNADPGSQLYTVQCPADVPNCPIVESATSSQATFQPLQSGQYTVTYKKTVAGKAESCSYSLYVGTSGVRVELTWDNAGIEAASGALKGPDLDLQVHRPNTTTSWTFGKDSEVCYSGNCQIENFTSTGMPGESVIGPKWFSEDPTASPPHNWTLSPTASENSCYFAPRGKGSQWAALEKGCHNPRLDLDNFGCDATIKDSSNPSFCAPENINLDEYPDKSWFRIAVDYFGVCTQTLSTHPVISIYCSGGQVAQLGSRHENGTVVSSGYNAPVTFTPADCKKRFWIAADVYVRKGECNTTECTVVPIYADAAQKTPYFVNKPSSGSVGFGPAYPPAPSP